MLLLEQIFWAVTIATIAVCIIISWVMVAMFFRILYSSPGSSNAINARWGISSLPRSNFRPLPALLRLRKLDSGDDSTLPNRSAHSGSMASAQQVNCCNSEPISRWPAGRDWSQLESRMRSKLRALRKAAVCRLKNTNNCNSNNQFIDYVQMAAGLPAEPEAIMLQYTYLYDMA